MTDIAKMDSVQLILIAQYSVLPVRYPCNVLSFCLNNCKSTHWIFACSNCTQLGDSVESILIAQYPFLRCPLLVQCFVILFEQLQKCATGCGIVCMRIRWTSRECGFMSAVATSAKTTSGG